MGPWCYIGALIVLLGTTGETSNSNNNSNNNLQNGNSALQNAVIEEPEFTDIIENVTVPAGRNVKLGCSVKNLGSYKGINELASTVSITSSFNPYIVDWLKSSQNSSIGSPTSSTSSFVPNANTKHTSMKVAWMHFEQSAILTVHNHVITRNPRISVTHDKHDKHKTWFLHINNVHEEDKGRYMCQINTVTAKTQFGYLHVVVPPNIDDSLSSSDVIVREGANMTLRCRATGSPPPLVKWKRDDGTKITINKSLAVSEWDGDVLEMSKISRLDMGAYLCIASNGVPPTVSKRIKVSVDFPPMLWIPHQLVGVPVHHNVTMECFTEAHPTSLNYWTRDDGNMIHESRKYRTESFVETPPYKTHMKLTIHNIQHDDYGTYKCVAKNPRGETDGTIRLYVSTPPTTAHRLLTTETYHENVDRSEFNHTLLGPPTSYHVHFIDKNSRFQSNLNEIDKSEQKLQDNTKGYNWPSENLRNNKCDKAECSSILIVTILIGLLFY